MLEPPKAKPPRPPRGLSEAERRAWRELARQVEALGVFTASDYSVFRLAVKALAAVDAAPADLKPTSRRGLIESAAKLLARLGLDPVARQQVDATPPADLTKGKAPFLPGMTPLIGPGLPDPTRWRQ